jgi:hypothetical protein
MYSKFSTLCAALAVFMLLPLSALAAGAANDHTVLALGATVNYGTNSLVVQIIESMGYDVEIATDEQWAAKTTADFATYRAVILADPDCTEGTVPVAAAEANTSVWGPAIDGNVLVIGTDPVYHTVYFPGPEELIRSGLAYVLSTPKEAGKTGAYISLSCYFNENPGDHTVELLRYFGPFVVTDNTTCHDDIEVVAPLHPAMTGITDADLSYWNCSIHELFVQWPASFAVLAIADGLGSAYNVAGNTGTPYILARNATGTMPPSECPTPPSITISGVSPSTLWSPNNKMVGITVNAAVVGNLVNVTRTITSSEVVADNKMPFYEDGSDVFHFKLRAARNGNNKAGRTYTITFTGTDACGQMVSTSTTVFVPHDQSKLK